MLGILILSMAIIRNIKNLFAYIIRSTSKTARFIFFLIRKGLVPMWNEVKDSGVREEFSTGSKRDTANGKGRYDLIPFFALHRLAVHYENGAKKYGDHNWRKGQPLSRYVSSALRHITKWAMGFRDEDHLSAAAWNIFSIIETEEMIARGRLPQELDDVWKGYSD